MYRVEAGFINRTGQIESVREHNEGGDCTEKVKTEVRYRFYPKTCTLVIETLHGVTDQQVKVIRGIYRANPVDLVVLSVCGFCSEYATFIDRTQKGKFFLDLQSFILQSV